MVRARIHLVAATLAAVAAVPGGPARAADTAQRLALLASQDGSAWYGSDPSDAELAAAEVGCVAVATDATTRRCPAATTYAVWFYPRLLLGEPVIWDATSPLRFHVALAVEGASPSAVRLQVQHGGSVSVSGPAVEVAPGVFEGALATGSPMDPVFATPIGVQVSLSAPASRIAVGTGGASFVDLPAPVTATSVPRLLAGDTYRPAPSVVPVGERTFTFNDGAWQSWTFAGSLRQAQSFPVPLAGEAAVLFAWAEPFSDPYAHGVAGGGDPDPSRLSQYPRLRLIGPAGDLDARERTVAGYSVPAAGISVEVSRDTIRSELSQITDGLPYTLRVVAAYGPRTLGAMRWPAPQPRWYAGRTPVVAVCPYGQEPIPQPPDAPTFDVRLSWDGPAASLQDWTLNYTLPGAGFVPCGEHYTRTSIRFTLPGPRLWVVGPTPAQYARFVATQDVRFELTVRYTYTPA